MTNITPKASVAQPHGDEEELERPHSAASAIDSVLVLTTQKDRCAAKRLQANGKIGGYDKKLKWFKPEVFGVSNIRELSALLFWLERDKRRLIIRGEYSCSTPPAWMQHEAGYQPGYFVRRQTIVRDVPHRWMMIDIDKHIPADGVDPIVNPELAIRHFLKVHLPQEFQNVDFHWQLSGSAGHPSAAGQLRAHVWFWLKTAYTTADLKRWAVASAPLIDLSIFHIVQCHFTAKPIFAPGVSDPVPVRSGFFDSEAL